MSFIAPPRLSGVLPHFSERHLFDPIYGISNRGEEKAVVTFVVNDQDVKFPESSWFEIAKRVNDCLLIVICWLQDYLESKESVANRT